MLVGTRIPGGLPAASLRRGHDDIATGPFEQLDGGKADLRPDEVDETGDEQSDARSLGHRLACPRGALRGRFTRGFEGGGISVPSA